MKVRGDDFLEKRFILRMIRREFKNDAKGYRIDYDITEFADDPDATTPRTQRKILDKKFGAADVINVVKILDESEYTERERKEKQRLGENYYVMEIHPDAFHRINDDYGLNRLDEDGQDWNEKEYSEQTDNDVSEGDEEEKDEEHGDKDIVFEIGYDKNSRAMSINGKRIKKFYSESGNSILFEQVYSNPGKEISVGEERCAQEVVSGGFGFREKARQVFFPEVTEKTIKFMNPITEEYLRSIGMKDVTLHDLFPSLSE